MNTETKNEVTTTEKPSAPAAGAMKVAPKGAARAEVGILTRLKDKDSADSLYNIILQMTGGDTLFVEKFAVCCKMQVDRHWKFDAATKKWTNPFLVIPINSQLDALYECASHKVLPDGYNCNLIPYLGRDEKRVDVSVDFKGLIDTAIKEKIILDCDAKEVCEGDDFVWSLGEVERWSFDPRKPRGKVCGFCAWAVLPNGRKKWSYMSLPEIADVRKCAKTQMIWNKWEGEMSKKTVIRRLFKTLPNTPNLVNLMAVDNASFVDMEQDGTGAFQQKHRSAAPVRQLTGANAALPAPETPSNEEVAAPEAPAEAAPAETVQPELQPVFA